MNKRLLALLVAMLMIVVSVGAMAEGQNISGSSVEVPINKTFAGDHAAETLTFTVTPKTAPAGVELENVRTITMADVDQAGSASIELNASDYKVPGEYTYEVKENAGNTAGVTYDPAVYTLKVQAYLVDGQMQISATLRKGEAQAKNKSADFENIYLATTESTDPLTVAKVIEGNGADSRDEFVIQVSFPKSMDGKTLSKAPSYSAAAGAQVTMGHTDEDYVFNMTVNGGESVKFYNLPTGWRYAVTETNATGSVSGQTYTATYSANQNGTITVGTPTTVTVTNTFDLTIDTGVNTDVLPYVMLMAIVAAGAVIFLMKRRAIHE